MAPSTTDAAASARPHPVPNHAIRPVVPRITPVIPLTFSRDRKPKPLSVNSTTAAGASVEGAEKSAESLLGRDEKGEAAHKEKPLTPVALTPQDSKPASSVQSIGGSAVEEAATDNAPTVAASTDLKPSEKSHNDASTSVNTSAPHLRGGDAGAHPRHGQDNPPFNRSSPLELAHGPSSNRSPYNGSSQPVSAHSATHPSDPPSLHHPRPSADELVFGGYSDSASPSPPETTFPNGISHPFAPAVLPAVISTFVPYTLTYNKAHQEAVPETYPPPGLPPATHGHGATSTQTAQQPNLFNPEANFFPRAMARSQFGGNQLLSNGEAMSRHTSQASSGARELVSPHSLEGMPPPASDGVALESRQGSGDAHNQINGRVSVNMNLQTSARESVASSQNPHYPSQLTPAPASRMENPDLFTESALVLRDWMLQQVGRPDLADHILEVNYGDQVIFEFPVHSVIVSRSPTLLAAISGQASNAARQQDALPRLKLEVKDGFFMSFALRNALDYLYGAPLPYFYGVVQALPPVHVVNEGPYTDFAVQAMDHALGLISAGFLLQLEEIKVHGLAFAKRVLRWETIEKALAFALDGGFNPAWLMGDPGQRSGAVDPSSNKSTYGEFAKDLLLDIVEFIVHNFPPGFEFIAISPQLARSPRLPTVIASHGSTSSARLSHIQFGEVPVEQPKFSDSIISSILLSVPFIVLKAVVEHHALLNRLTAAQIAELARFVVGEREERRLRTLQGKRISPSRDPGLWEATKWEERVINDKQGPTGTSIAREQKANNATYKKLSGGLHGGRKHHFGYD